MLKLIFCLRRLPHLSRTEFQSYWLEQHAPLVQRHAQALGIRRYVQSHTLDDSLNEALRASRGGPAPYDGAAEIWWDSRAELESALASPAGQEAGAALLADERRFIDLESSPLWVSEERAILG